jgi:hypothetical protein
MTAATALGTPQAIMSVVAAVALDKPDRTTETAETVSPHLLQAHRLPVAVVAVLRQRTSLLV